MEPEDPIPALDEGLAQMAERLAEEARRASPNADPYPYPRLMPRSAESAIRAHLLAPNPMFERFRRSLPPPPKPWTNQWVIRRFRAIRNDYAWRLKYAWRHLRGIDCECD